MFLTIKTLSQNIWITLLQISLKLHEQRGCYWKKKFPWMIFEEQFLVPRYTATSKIGNSVISLLWQLRCRCNPDHNKFSSLSNTTLLWWQFFQIFVYGEVVYAQTWEVTVSSHLNMSRDGISKTINNSKGKKKQKKLMFKTRLYLTSSLILNISARMSCSRSKRF